MGCEGRWAGGGEVGRLEKGALLSILDRLIYLRPPLRRYVLLTTLAMSRNSYTEFTVPQLKECLSSRNVQAFPHPTFFPPTLFVVESM